MPTTRKRKAPSQESIESVQKSPKRVAKSATKHIASQSDSEPQPAIVCDLNGDGQGTSNDSSSTQSPSCKSFTIPTADNKEITCQLHGLGAEQLSEIRNLLIFTHGAGGDIETPTTKLFAEGCAASSVPVLCFQGTMNLKNRVKAFQTVFEHCREQYPDCEISVGGSSMGARAAVMLAGEHEEVRKIVASSYPLISPKGDVRDEILLDLGKGKEVCFLSGESDTMCDFEKLEEIRAKMSAQSKLVIVKGVDHGMSLVGKVKNKGSAVEAIRKKGGHFAACWIRGDHDDSTGKTTELQWDEDSEQVVINEASASKVGHPGEEKVNTTDEGEREPPDKKKKKQKTVSRIQKGKSDTRDKVQNKKNSGKVLSGKRETKSHEEERAPTPRRSKRNKD